MPIFKDLYTHKMRLKMLPLRNLWLQFLKNLKT